MNPSQQPLPVNYHDDFYNIQFQKAFLRFSFPYLGIQVACMKSKLQQQHILLSIIIKQKNENLWILLKTIPRANLFKLHADVHGVINVFDIEFCLVNLHH